MDSSPPSLPGQNRDAERILPGGLRRRDVGRLRVSSLEEANEILGLMMRHWNISPGRCSKRGLCSAPAYEDEDGIAHGNDWARGFMRGMGMRHDGWAELVNDEEHGGCLIPMMMLCHEHDKIRRCVPSQSAPEKREELSLRWRRAVGGVSVFPGARKAFAGTTFAPETSAQCSQDRAE